MAMCGRYVIKTSTPEIARILGASGELLNTPERYNVAPTEQVPACRIEDGQRRLVMLKWGLIPAWSKDPRRSAWSTINARAETVHEKPAYRAAFRARRCLLAADGYYEWRKVGEVKQPAYFHAADDGLLVFAGLWERWGRGEDAIESCSIVTTDANADVASFHHRMPVLLDDAAARVWLDSEAPREALSPLMCPAPAGTLAHHLVSTRVNAVRNDGAECIAPLQPDPA